MSDTCESVNTISPKDAIEIITLVSDYSVKMCDIFASRQLPADIGLAQCNIALEMMRFIILVNSKVKVEVDEDA